MAPGSTGNAPPQSRCLPPLLRSCTRPLVQGSPACALPGPPAPSPGPPTRLPNPNGVNKRRSLGHCPIGLAAGPRILDREALVCCSKEVADLACCALLASFSGPSSGSPREVHCRLDPVFGERTNNAVPNALSRHAARKTVFASGVYSPRMPPVLVFLAPAGSTAPPSKLQVAGLGASAPLPPDALSPGSLSQGDVMMPLGGNGAGTGVGLQGGGPAQAVSSAARVAIDRCSSCCVAAPRVSLGARFLM